jgi:hypothetical protein
MNLAHNTARLACATLLIAASTACGVAATPKDKPATPALVQQLQAAIGEAACDNSAQCHTVAVGHKACGGPERYLAWSDKAGKGAQIVLLAQQHAQARRDENQRSGAISNCAMALDPGAVCSAKRCILAPAGGAAAQ